MAVAGALLLVLSPDVAAVEPPYLEPWVKIAAQSEPGRTYLPGGGVRPEAKEVRWRFQPPLAFTNAFQVMETDRETTAKISGLLGGIDAMTIGGWFYCRRTGEESFLCRGVPVIAPDGERVFPPRDEFVSFCLGMDQRGFLYGTIHGNGTMPFPYVTLNEIYINRWHQLVVVKDARGRHTFYQNGAMVHCDADRVASGFVRPFREAARGGEEPIRLSMPMGGMIGEVWIVARTMSAEEIRGDYEAKKESYKAAPPYPPVGLREMDMHPAANRWVPPVTKENWSEWRDRIASEVEKRLGASPNEKVPLDPKEHEAVDCGTYTRRKVSFAVQPGDRMPAYLLVPKEIRGRVPAVICMYGTTSGAGKETTVGLSGRAPGTKPHPNYSFAIDMVEAGFVALAPDWLRDGERVRPGERPYETTSFRRAFPDWSIAGKDVWDTSRAIDYLETLPFVDPKSLGMTGHSYGGGGTIHAAALDPRITVAVANGPVSDAETYHELTSLIAPRPLLVGQAVGERRPEEEEIYAAVHQVYRALGHPERALYLWYPGDHDYPPAMREAAVAWFRQWFDGKP